MNIEEVRDYCLTLKHTTESFPFDEPHIAVKCDPEQAEELRAHYVAVEPTYHLHKKYWNGIYLERDMPDDEIRRWIRHSYEEVLRKLPKRIRETYGL